MGTRKELVWVLLVIFATTALVVGPAIQAGADALKYKAYTYTIKEANLPVGDEEGHQLVSFERGGILVFDNGEVANYHMIGTGEQVKGGASIMFYETFFFADGSTIIGRVQGTIGAGVPGVPSTGGFKHDLVKGTGRFIGIKGTAAGQAKFLRLEKWQAGASSVGEGAFEYTLPSK